jgi:hypothetical protein
VLIRTVNIYHQLANCIQIVDNGVTIFSQLVPHGSRLFSAPSHFSILCCVAEVVLVLVAVAAGGGVAVLVLLVRDANAVPNLGRSNLPFRNLFRIASNNPGRSIAEYLVRVYLGSGPRSR